MTRLRELIKAGLCGFARVLVAPLAVVYYVQASILGRDRALENLSQVLSLVPGLAGRYLRNGFLFFVIDECAPSAVIEFGVLFSKTGARIGAGVYIGPRCCLGLVTLEENALLGPGVQIPSGRYTHGMAADERPHRDQPGRLCRVTIGRNVWIGAGAIVMADVGPGTIVGAGTVVPTFLPEGVVAVGNPARIVRHLSNHTINES